MALRIFQVTTDGVAIAVQNGEGRGEQRSPGRGEPPSPKAGSERWTGSAEWDRLRARLLEQAPLPLDDRRASRRQ